MSAKKHVRAANGDGVSHSEFSVVLCATSSGAHTFPLVIVAVALMLAMQRCVVHTVLFIIV